MAKKVKRPFYSVDERMQRVWDVEEIKDLMCRRAFYFANDMRREELVDLWVHEPKHMKKASFGSNWGWYVGMNEISNYYVVQHNEKRKKELAGYCAANSGVENNNLNLGYGSYIARPMSTPMVILADDGQTAKGMWYSLGQESLASGAGEASCRWYNDRLAADFVKEDGEWKIWHLVISNDVSVLAGENTDDLPTKPEPGTYVPENDFGEPTIKMLTHNMAMNWSDNYPNIPRPYYAYDEETGYGPEGHPDYEY